MAQRFCMKCGKPLNATDKFCIYCGTLAGAVAPGKNPSVQAGGPKPGRPPMQQMGGGMRPPVQQQPGAVPGSRTPQYVQPTGQFPVQAPMQPAGQFPVQPPVQPARPPMRQNARPPMQQPVQPVGQIPQQMRSPFGGMRQAAGSAPAQEPPTWGGASVAPAAPGSPFGGSGMDKPAVLPGDEFTSVLEEEKAFPSMGNDEQTTVLAPSLTVTLERQRTGETYKLDLPCVIGKGSAADCRIANNTAISRRHLRIMSDETTGGTPHIVLEDLGSLNKTRLNGDPVTRGVPRSLLDGDTITMADEDFLVHIHES